MKPRLLPVALLGLAALLSGCAAPDAAPYPRVPPLPSETIPKPPVTATPLLWEPGHWDWIGGGYVWRPGRYVARDGHGNMFMPGWWRQTGSGYEWVPAHWL